MAYFYYRKKSSDLNKNVNLGFIFLRISEYSFFRIYIPLIFFLLCSPTFNFRRMFCPIPMGFCY
ncbi:hypothetical protein LEP1GSC072_1791 [Leptospira noguchii str. Bonito]|nr:hypothetical protein LEP1GSC072_1791 [Leptospira noguchii str. Bonito]